MASDGLSSCTGGDFMTAAADNDARAIVRASIAANSEFDAAYVVMNGLATVIACYGLFANSPAVVIGAMIICSPQ